MLRWADSSDAESLARVHIASWQATYRGQIPDPHLDGLDHAARAEWFHRTIAAGGAIIVSVVDYGPAGFCYFGPSRSESGWGEVYAIYVDPLRIGSGHGGALLSRAESELAEQGFERALLWVLHANSAARSFYERQGWTIVRGVKIEEIGGVQVSEVRYEKVLPEPSARDRDRPET